MCSIGVELVCVYTLYSVQDARDLLLIFRSRRGYKNANAAKHIITSCYGAAAAVVLRAAATLPRCCTLCT